MTQAFTIQQLCYRAGTTLPTHHHAPATLSLILEGEQREQVGRQQHDCARLSAVLKGPGIEHANYVGARLTRGLFVELSPETEHSVRDAVGSPLGAVRVADGVTRHLVRRVAQELRLGQAGASLIIEGLIFEVLGALIRKHSARTPRRSDRALRRAVDYLESNYRRRLRIPEIAGHAGVHPSTLAELFRASYSVSVGEWVRNRRLEFAREALRSSASSISSIAFQAGFADQSHLTRLFRARFGLSPAEYRRSVC